MVTVLEKEPSELIGAVPSDAVVACVKVMVAVSPGVK
jgi:hypothetical protein